MPVTTAWFGLGLLNAMRNNIDLEVGPYNFTLHTSSYTPNRDTQDFYDDVTNELTATGGYVTGGFALASLALSFDAASDQVQWNMDDIVVPFSASKTWRYGVVRRARGGAASADELVALLTWDSDQTVSAPHTFVIDPAGLLYLDTT